MSDIINRQDAIKALGDAHFQNYGNAIMVIQELPSVETIERTAKVIDKSAGRHSIIEFDWVGKCEKCGNGIQYAFDYCPYCGSRLDWSDDENR